MEQIKVGLYKTHKPLQGQLVDLLKTQNQLQIEFIEVQGLLENSELTLCIGHFDQAQELKDIKSSWLVLTSAKDPTGWVRFLNHSAVVSLLSEDVSPEKILTELGRVIEEQVLVAGAGELVREHQTRNLHLKNLTIGLEELIEERTEYIRNAKQQAEERQKKMRSFLLFLKDLGPLLTLESALVKIREEFRSIPHVADVFLMTTDRGSELWTLSNKTLKSFKDLPLSFDSKSVERNSVAARPILANVLSRPVAKVMSLPFQLKTFKKSWLLVEHDAQDNELQPVLDFIMERIQPITLCLERVTSHDKYEKASHEWESVFDEFQDPITIVDKEFSLLRSNLTLPGGGTSKCYELFAERTSPCIDCPLASEVPIRAGGSSAEVRIKERLYRLTLFPILDVEKRQMNTYVCHYHDLTREREIHSRFIYHEKMLALGVLAGHVAHELNNPLTGIRALSQYILSDLKNQQETTFYQDLIEIEKGTARCQNIIKSLLDFTSADNEENKAFSLDQIVEQTLTFLKTALRSVSVEEDFQCQDVLTQANPNLIQQVIFNLVNNACQAMSQGGVVRLKTYHDNKYSYLDIEDIGTGIPTDILPKIFDPFFTTKKEGQGTGLGLSLSASLVKKYGGRLELVKTDASGTIFRMSLPCAKVSHET